MASNPWETTEAQKEDKEVVAFDQASRLLEALRFRSEVFTRADWKENGLQRSRLLVEQPDSAHDVRLGRLAHEQPRLLSAVAVHRVRGDRLAAGMCPNGSRKGA